MLGAGAHASRGSLTTIAKVDHAGNENERELLAQLRAGDEDAFGLVVQRYGGRMLATARRFLNNECDAQDAVQEAFRFPHFARSTNSMATRCFLPGFIALS